MSFAAVKSQSYLLCLFLFSQQGQIVCLWAVFPSRGAHNAWEKTRVPGKKNKKSQADAVFMLLTFFSIQRNAPLSSSSSFPMSSHPPPFHYLSFASSLALIFRIKESDFTEEGGISASLLLSVPLLLFLSLSVPTLFFFLLSLHPTLILHFSSIFPLLLLHSLFSLSFFPK